MGRLLCGTSRPMFALLALLFTFALAADERRAAPKKSLDLKKMEAARKAALSRKKKRETYYGDPKYMGEKEKKRIANKVMRSRIEDYVSSKRSPAGRKVRKFDKTTAQDFSIGKGRRYKQSFKFRMKAAQTKASVRYKGLVDLDFSYQALNQNFLINYTEPVGKDTDIFIEHFEAPEERLDQVGVRYKF